MPPIGYQGRQSSCVGWAVAYYCRSYQEGVENGRAPTQSAQIFSPAFIYNQRPTSDVSRDAGMTLLAGLNIAVDQGVASLQAMPYDPYDCVSQPSEEALAEAAQYRARSYASLFIGSGQADLQIIKQYLAGGVPVLMGVPIYADFYSATPAHPVIDLPGPDARIRGGHAVTLVGYDDSAGLFKFANSWGSWWGAGGYAFLTYEFVQHKAWEAWVLFDADTTPPVLPEQARELNGAASGTAQSAISSPAFAWDATEPGLTYQVYWGRDPKGLGEYVTTEPAFEPEPLSESGEFHLRVRAWDAAGNACAWRALFVFCYEPNETAQEAFDEHPLVCGDGIGLLRVAPPIPVRQ
jgi:hypothetical protein